MKDSDAQRLIRGLADVNQTLKVMNTNHADIGRLFKTWLETVPAEAEELELPDRPAFTIGAAARCTDPFNVHYKHIGVVEKIESTQVRVKFLHTETYTPYFEAGQLEVLPQPKLKIGDQVRIIDPHSITYEEIGTVTKTAFEGAEVRFPSGSGGNFSRRNVELIEADAPFKQFVAPQLYPRNWRIHFTMSLLMANWEGATREDELMTEEAFREYSANLRSKNLSFHDVADEKDVPDPLEIKMVDEDDREQKGDF